MRKKMFWAGAALASCLLFACASQSTRVSSISSASVEKSGTLRLGEPQIAEQTGRETVTHAGLTAHGQIHSWEAGTRRSIDYMREEWIYRGIQANGKADVERRVFRGSEGKLEQKEDVFFDAQGGQAKIGRFFVSFGSAQADRVAYKAKAP